jgi:hypothetical protein
MANEIKIAKAAREIARELNDLPAESRHPFGYLRTFIGNNRTPCCAIGHVIQRAGLADLPKGRPSSADPNKLSWVSSTSALCDVFGVEELPDEVFNVIDGLVGSNDRGDEATIVAAGLYRLADALELEAAPKGDASPEA